MTSSTVSPAPPITVFVEGIGLLGPGISDWPLGRQYLAGELPYQSTRSVLPLPMALPAAERRRAGAVLGELPCVQNSPAPRKRKSPAPAKTLVA